MRDGYIPVCLASFHPNSTQTRLVFLTKNNESIGAIPKLPVRMNQ